MSTDTLDTTTVQEPAKKMDVHYSSKTELWNTPQELFNNLNEEFTFTLDPCCLPHTAKCENYFTPVEDGLKQSWEGHSVFINPPYGRAMPPWIAKAYEESQKPNTTCVMLLPARTDTRWFHDYVVKGEVRLIKGRIKFVDNEGNEGDAAPFPSMIVVFGRPACFKTSERNGILL